MLSKQSFLSTKALITDSVASSPTVLKETSKVMRVELLIKNLATAKKKLFPNLFLDRLISTSVLLL